MLLDMMMSLPGYSDLTRKSSVLRAADLINAQWAGLLEKE
jgi:hypothetical protein